MVYQWKIPKYKVDAQKAGEAIEAIPGDVTPEKVVNASRDESAVLHPLFDWNDTTAAEKYRQVQAGDIIRNLVTVHISEQQKQDRPVRCFVSIEKSYKPMDTVLKTPSYRETMLADARRDLEAFASKYKSLSELSEVISSINDFLETGKGEEDENQS